MLKDIFESLSTVTDSYLWGTYALSRDILKNRVDETNKRDMFDGAIRCGQAFAEQIMKNYPGGTIREIMKGEGLRVISSGEVLNGERILFAQFTPPDEVIIMEEPLRKYEALLQQEKLFNILPPVEEVYQLLLGHELFHFLEDKNQDTIYTRNQKIVLWKFWKFTYQSTVRALSELAAMYFSQTLNGLKYSAFIVDVLLFYSYDKKSTRINYEDMKQMFHL